MLKECPKHGWIKYTGEAKLRCPKCNSQNVTNRRKRLKQKAVEYKGGKCIRCGYNKSLSALEFHHCDPKEKDFALGGKRQTAAWDKIKKELDKCDLVCANCHREIHEEMRETE